tara:strand:- start:3920 stop:4660 length:741 start_codon:yes stop_codon:yes gene_type:complete
MNKFYRFYIELKGFIENIKVHMMFKFKKPKRDIRFLDSESLRHRSDLYSDTNFINSFFNKQVRHLKTRYVSGQIQDFKEPDDTWVRVEQEKASSTQNSYSFLKLIISESNHLQSLNNVLQVNDIESITLFAVKDSVKAKKIGVFSDSKIYSSLIHSVLNPYSLTVGHFNHPNTFVEKKYKEFDEIDAWVIFLSEEDESDFLDKFLSRYEDKPTLFLFPKMERSNCHSSINNFILEHGFIAKDNVSA